MAGLLAGKVVVVTGGGLGIGRAAALLAAKEGARVAVVDLGTDVAGEGQSSAPAEAVAAEIRALGGEAVAVVADVAQPEGAASFVQASVDAFGRVDVLLESAGFLRDRTLLKMKPEDYDAVVGVHLRGAFLCTQAFARRLVMQGEGGRIVLFTSISGMLGNFGQANYASAKAGIYGLMRTAAIELQKHRVTINALAPLARTRMTEDLPMMEGVDNMTPEHVAPAAIFLGSDLCGDRTGHVLAVAGARMYAYRMMESTGRFKEENDGVWTPEEIAEHWNSIVKIAAG